MISTNRHQLTPQLSQNSSKLLERHLSRLAVVYIRQSTLQQVERHQESTRLQYALVDRAQELGWSHHRILVIDEDLGRSGASADGRPGFQRLVFEIGLDHVGLVLGVEMSRLARSCRDWHQLLDTCAIFGTLIGDSDGLYDPTCYNDRLLLGLKGTMSEAELHIIKQRMLAGRLARARRGELGMALPMGYTHRPSGEVIVEPDEQARATIELVFELFERLNTVNAVLAKLVAQGVKLPVRVRSGAEKGELEWHRPNRVSLLNLLRNPLYAGAYVWGRRPTDPRRKRPGRPSSGRTVAGPDQWQVLIKDHYPAYISWERYERNLLQLKANSAQGMGVPRRGAALLPGLVVCGRCGHKMAVGYQSRGHYRYHCSREAIEYGSPRCQSLTGVELDRAVCQLVLKAMEPAALELALQAASTLEAQRKQECGLWEKRLERARYETERAFRQYNVVEPENRLVARTLERRWEELLGVEQSLREDYTRYLSENPPVLGQEERDIIRSLAHDLPTLWHAPTTTVLDRIEIIRLLMDRVLVRVEGDSERVDVEIHWAGGHRTQLTCRRSVALMKQLSDYQALMARVAELFGEGLKQRELAARLNEEGWKPPKRRDSFSESMVAALLSRQGLSQSKPLSRKAFPAPGEGEWTLQALALHLDIPSVTLFTWLKKGVLTARKEEQPPRRWLIQADEAELNRLRAYRQRVREWLRPARIPEPPCT